MPKKKAGKNNLKARAREQSEQITPRRFKKSNYETFKLSKRIKHPKSKLSSAYKIFKSSLAILKKNWRLFLTITLIYGFLSVILVRGFGGLQLSELKTALKGGFSGNLGSLATGLALFSYLLGSAGSSASPTGGVYQTLLIVIVSLATIWTLRQVLAGNKVRARDGFYRGIYPLIPFILVLMVIGLQLIPLALGAWLYSTVISAGIAVGGLEKFIWIVFFFLLAVLSIYMICSSIFALYIVTLPDMTPMKALRSARQLVLHRRWTVIRKVLFLPFGLLITGALIMVPMIIYATGVSEWIFFLLSMTALLVVHAYMYTLYRELL